MAINAELFPKNPRWNIKMKNRFDPDGKGYVITKSDIFDYNEDFGLLPQSRELTKIFDRLRALKRSVVIDLFSTPHALGSLHGPVLNRLEPMKALALGDLKDDRSSVEVAFDDVRGIAYRQDDLNEGTSWDAINDWLGDDRADLIMERAFAGLHFIPNNTLYYRVAFRRMWDMLAEGGYMLLQLPPFDLLEERGIPINAYLQLLREKGIYEQHVASYDSKDGLAQKYGLLMVRKDADSQVLPEIFDLIKPKPKTS